MGPFKFVWTSLAGAKHSRVWIEVEEMASIECSQVFKFILSRSYRSETMVEIPLVVQPIYSKDDVQTCQVYLVDAEISFLCKKGLCS